MTTKKPNNKEPYIVIYENLDSGHKFSFWYLTEESFNKHWNNSPEVSGNNHIVAKCVSPDEVEKLTSPQRKLHTSEGLKSLL